jgi:hypothetical protein
MGHAARHAATGHLLHVSGSCRPMGWSGGPNTAQTVLNLMTFLKWLISKFIKVSPKFMKHFEGIKEITGTTSLFVSSTKSSRMLK